MTTTARELTLIERYHTATRAQWDTVDQAEHAENYGHAAAEHGTAWALGYAREHRACLAEIGNALGDLYEDLHDGEHAQTDEAGVFLRAEQDRYGDKLLGTDRAILDWLLGPVAKAPPVDLPLRPDGSTEATR